MLYVEFPEQYVWMAKSKKWRPHQRDFSIGRIHFASPSSGEHFYLRTLLTIVRGPTSFQDFQSFQGTVHPTFKAACLACGLLEDDLEWRLCLQEAAGSQLRQLFTTLLLQCAPSDPAHLWDLFKEHICDNSQYQLQHKHHIEQAAEDQVYDFGLFLIDRFLLQAGKSLNQL